MRAVFVEWRLGLEGEQNEINADLESPEPRRRRSVHTCNGMVDRRAQEWRIVRVWVV